MDTFVDFYSVLRVTPRASDMEIKKAYRKLVLVYHPDKHPKGDQFLDYFLEIQKAYDVLTNPMLKRKYDQEYLTRYGSLNSHYIHSSDRIVHEIYHLATLARDYQHGGVPMQMIKDYFTYLVRDPHPQLLEEKLTAIEWKELGVEVLDVVGLIHYLDVKDEEESILKFMKAENVKKYEDLLKKMWRQYKFQQWKPWIIMLVSFVFLWMMYWFANP